jgi:hypothetical protein
LRVEHYEAAGEFDRVEYRLAYIEVDQGDGMFTSEEAPLLFERETAFDLRELPDAFEYAAQVMRTANYGHAGAAFWGDLYTRKYSDGGGPGLSAKDLGVVHRLELDLKRLKEALGALRIAADDRETLADIFERLAAGAYSLGRVLRESELQVFEPAARRGGRVGDGARAGGKKTGSINTDLAVGWRKPFLAWLQEKVNTANAEGSSPLSGDAVLELAASSWPAAGFAHQQVRPERSTLKAAIEWGSRQRPSLFDRPSAARGRKKSTPQPG